MSYQIDSARRVVRARAWGELSARELDDVMSRIALDPRFEPTFQCVADFRDVTSIRMDVLEIAQAAAAPLFAEGTRHAIVATSDQPFGMARMFASFSERIGQDVRVFRDVTAAEAWLDEERVA